MTQNINKMATAAMVAENDERVESARDFVWETLNRGNPGEPVERDDVRHVTAYRFEVHGASFRVIGHHDRAGRNVQVVAKSGVWTPIYCLADIAKAGGAQEQKGAV